MHRGILKAVLALWVCLGGGVLTVTPAQDKFSPEDEATLKEAEKTADQFIERFRQTLDFKTTWEEFRRDNKSCVVRANGVTSESLREELKLSDDFLETLYVAVMNYYYLKFAHDLSKVKIGATDEPIIPKDLANYVEKSKYLSENSKDPQSVDEINDMVSELNHIAKLYKQHMPKDAMNNDIWKANIKYFEEYKREYNRGVQKGWSDICVSETKKVYTFERCIFYFYFIMENGKLKIAGVGMD